MSCQHNSLMACFECSAKRTEEELRKARAELAWWREAFAPRFVPHGPGKLPAVGTPLAGIRLKVYVAAPPGRPDVPWQPYNGGQKCDANEGPCACGAWAVPNRCTLPPPGWWCSRDPDHEGPCAARPLPPPACAACRGLRVFFGIGDDGSVAIQRCDACRAFETDKDAAEHVARAYEAASRRP